MIYFGTKDRMIWAKPPAVNTPLSKTGTSNTGVDLNGGGYAKLSPAASRDYTFTWGASPAKDIYDILDYRTGAYGNGLLYYLDPFAMKCNVLSESFSFPRMLCDIYKMGGTNSQPTGSRAIRENMFRNPSFERARTSGSNTVTRTNRVLSPRATEADKWTASFAVGGAGNISFDNSGVGGSPVIRATWTVKPTSNVPRIIVNNDTARFVSVQPGETLTFSCDVTSNAPEVRLMVDFRTDTSWVSSRSADIVVGSQDTSNPTRAALTFTVPDGITKLQLFVGLLLANTNPGTYVTASRALVEEASQAYPYFDGDNPPVVGPSSAWSGAVNNSVSTSTIYTEKILTNLVPTPSYTVNTSKAEVRRNRCRNPQAVSSTTYWDVFNGLATIDRPYASSPVGNTFVRFTITGSGTGNIIGGSGLSTNAHAALSPNTTYTYSAWVRSPSVTRNIRFGFNERSASGDNIGDTNGGNISLPANQWVRLSSTITTGATTAWGGVRIVMPTGTALPAGAAIDVTGVLIESGSVELPYFDGSVQVDSDWDSEWSGTAGLSESFARIQGVVGASVALTNRWAYASKDWSMFGGQSLRITPRTTSSDSESLMFGTSTGMEGFEAGKTYTAAAYIRLKAPLTGQLNGMALSLQLAYNTVAGWTGASYVRSSVAPNVAGVHLVKFTFTVPANAVWAALRGYNGASVGGGDVWYDGITIVEGDVPNLTPFDGSNSYDSDFYSQWNGTPGNSTSSVSGMIPIRSGSQGGTSMSILSQQWSSRGRYSVRTLPISNSSANTWTSPSDTILYLVPGKTYTVSVRCHVKEPLRTTTGALRAYSGVITVLNSSYSTFAESNRAPNEAGTYDLSVTFTPTVEWNSFYIRLYTGVSVGGGDVWWDEAILTEGAGATPYFDGSFPDSDGYDYGWTGTEHDSASTISVSISNPNYTTLNQPIAVAVSGASSAKHYIPVPSGYSLWVSYVATANILQANGTAITATYPTDTVYQWTKFTNSQELQWVGSGTVWGAQAVILRNGETPDPNHQWTPGKGNSGLRFSGEPQVNGLSAVIGGHAGMVNASATFKETGLWE